MTHALNDTLATFLAAHAESLDAGADHSNTVLDALGAADLLRRGVPSALGGDDRPLGEAVEAIAAVAEHSLAAAFMYWGQRAFIEYLVQSPNETLRQRWLPDLLAGRQAGATGLSNAMKFLSGIEALRLRAQAAGQRGAGRLQLDGDVPWATNLRPSGFVVAVAVERDDGTGPLVAALPSDRAGLVRSADLDLIALRGSHTAALQVSALALGPEDVIASNARGWLPRVRPAFLGLQCGLSIGLARAALAAARAHGAQARPVLGGPIDDTQAALERAVTALQAGLADGRFIPGPVPLFELRIALADIVQRAVQLELQASGGRAYHRDQPLGFARRWRESAFIPIVTPSLTQLQGELLKRNAQQAAA